MTAADRRDSHDETVSHPQQLEQLANVFIDMFLASRRESAREREDEKTNKVA
jgi:hypothetical protein